jgi:hypothetical protein
METFQSLKAASEQKLKAADHLLGTTYSLVKEPKLLVSVIEHIHDALVFAIDAAIVHESLQKQAHGVEISQLEIFRRKIIPKYGLEGGSVALVTELKEILDKHKTSQVEFSKKQKYVISDNDYNLKTLTFDDAKQKILLTKKVIRDIFSRIEKSGA